jgi:hypothetical protein
MKQAKRDKLERFEWLLVSNDSTTIVYNHLAHELTTRNNDGVITGTLKVSPELFTALKLQMRKMV